MPTDRQTYKLTRIEKQPNRDMNRQTEEQIERETDRQRHKQIHRWTDKLSGKAEIRNILLDRQQSNLIDRKID